MKFRVWHNYKWLVEQLFNNIKQNSHLYADSLGRVQKCLMSKFQMPDTIIWWIWITTSIDLDRCCFCYHKILGIRRICASSRGYNTLLSSLYVIQLYEAFSDLVQRYTSYRTISVNCSYLCVKNTNNLDRGAKPNYLQIHSLFLVPLLITVSKCSLSKWCIWKP